MRLFSLPKAGRFCWDGLLPFGKDDPSIPIIMQHAWLDYFTVKVYKPRDPNWENPDAGTPAANQQTMRSWKLPSRGRRLNLRKMRRRKIPSLNLPNDFPSPRELSIARARVANLCEVEGY